MRTAYFRASIVALLGAGLALGFIACQKKLPSSPSELTTGVTIYEHRDFRGRSAHITTDVSDFEDYDGPCDHSSGSGRDRTVIYNWGDCVVDQDRTGMECDDLQG